MAKHRHLTIAIDGPASAGKGTVARGVARRLGYQYVDTGAMYRSLAYIARERGISWSSATAVAALAQTLDFAFIWDGGILRIEVDGQDYTRLIRSDSIGTGASEISAHPAVREALLTLQRDLGERGGVVMDGRDIGTVVLPNAELKVFLDAHLDIRAQRRHEELMRRGDVLSLSDVRTSLDARDRQDRERAIAPLRCANDAVRMDTSELTERQAVEAVLECIPAARRRQAVDSGSPK
ncbi:MAG: cytidylate kinase [Myxococcota bacterium]